MAAAAATAGKAVGKAVRAASTMASTATTAAGEMTEPAAAAVQQLYRSGENIFVWTHRRTKQTVYSLQRELSNKDALRQLRFVGKKSVPSALRRDMWTPLCVLSFPSAGQGLDVYNQLRQFRVLHETQWDPQDMMKREGPAAGKALVSKKEKIKRLQNQMANSVADMAAALLMQLRQPTEAEIKKARWFNTLPVRETSKGRVKVWDRPRFGMGSRPTLGAVGWRGSVSGVRIHWSDVLDAEFAETWPADVLHGRLETTRNGLVWPPRQQDADAAAPMERKADAAAASA